MTEVESVYKQQPLQNTASTMVIRQSWSTTHYSGTRSCGRIRNCFRALQSLPFLTFPLNASAVKSLVLTSVEMVILCEIT